MLSNPLGLSRNIVKSTKLRLMAQSHLRRVTECSAKLEEARQARDEAIREAWLSGEIYRDIAEAAGLSHQRVAQIVQRGRPKT